MNLYLIYYTVPLQLVVINLTTGEFTIHEIGNGRISDPGVAYSNGTLFLGKTQQLHSELYSYKDGVVQNLGVNPDRDWYRAVLHGDSVWWGTYYHGHIVEYRPGVGIVDHGAMDPSNTTPHWCYTLAIDPSGSYAYGSLGQAPWYLSVRNLSEGGAPVLYFKEDSDTGGTVYESVDGTEIWYWRRLASGVIKWYRLESGAVTETTDARPAFKQYWKQAGVNIESAKWLSEENVEVDLTDAIPTTGRNAVVRWRNAGETEWRSVGFDEIKLQDLLVHRVRPYSNFELLVSTGMYGPVYLYNLQTGVSTVLGWTPYSLYSFTQLGKKWYMSGYTSTTVEYDPEQSWTATRFKLDGTTNPRETGLDIGTYHYYSCAGLDGLLYVSANWERSKSGGELGWYDPASRQSGKLREGFEFLTPRGLCAVEGYIVYSGNSIHSPSQDGQLVLFNMSTKMIEKILVPLPGKVNTSAGCITTIGNDIIGISGIYAYRITVPDGVLRWQVELPGTAFGTTSWQNRHIELGANNMIYFHIGSDIYALDPGTGAVRLVELDKNNRSIMWHNKRGYIYGTTTLDTLSALTDRSLHAAATS